MTSIDDLVLRVRDHLQQQQWRLVLAESCTAGRVAASLSVVPGISQWLCGSFVVYRNDSKTQWLGIPQLLLDDPQVGPVSQPVTRLLSQRALEATPEAHVAAAVTGHIGPGCPVELDGRVFFCITTRTGSCVEANTHLIEPAPHDERDLKRRYARLEAATRFVLQSIVESNPNRTEN